MSYEYPWRSLSSASLALAVLLLVALAPSVRGTSPEPIVASHMDLDVALGTAKTYDLQTITVHDYTTVFQPANSTSNRTSSNGTYTLIPSPGPVLISLWTGNGAPIASLGGTYNLSGGFYVLSFAITPDFGFDTISMKVHDFSLNRTSSTFFNVVLSETYKYVLLQRWFANTSAWLVGNQQQNEAGRNTAALIENVGFAFVWVLLILLSLHRIARKHGTLSWVDRVKLGARATLYIDPMAQALDPEGHNADGVAELRSQAIRKESANLERLMVENLRNAVDIAKVLDLNDEERKFVDETVKTLRVHRGLDPSPPSKRIVSWETRRPTVEAGPDVHVEPAPVVAPSEAIRSTPSEGPKEGEKPRRKASKSAPKEETPS